MSTPDPFSVVRAHGVALPVVASIPHAGTWISEAVRKSLAPGMDGLPITDWHVDRLYDFLPGMGVTTVCAAANRFVVDANRDPDSRPLYPGRFETGLVPLTTFSGDTVFITPPDAASIEQRRVRWHAPYHGAIARLLEDALARAPRVLLLDLHSIASGANRVHPALENEIYLGNRDGASCSRETLDAANAAFVSAGLSVSVNTPYKGGYTTAHYGEHPRVEALQIEMCQRVYMNEAQPERAWETGRFDAAQQILRSVFDDLLGRVVPLTD